MADISGLNKTALDFYNSAVNGIYKSNSNIDTNETEGYSDSFPKNEE